ncbi:Uncharacterised protein [Klebsiella pneumoniae]|nr:Uncharacterised protein [Klebsiella pneumoniae]
MLTIFITMIKHSLLNEVIQQEYIIKTRQKKMDNQINPMPFY